MVERICGAGNVPHVRWWLDRWDVLQDCVADSYDTNDGTRNDTEPLLTDNDRADENVNLE